MQLWETIETVLGLHAKPDEFTIINVAARSLVVFLFAIVVVRLASRRFMAQTSALDVILTFVLGSMLSRTINGPAPLFPTIAGGVVLVVLHRLFAKTACRWHWFGNLVKGHEDVIIQNGQVREDALRHHAISHRDLLEDLRLKSCESPEQVKTATLERNGELSVIKQSS